MIAGKHVGIAVAAQRAVRVTFGVVPGAAGKLHDALAHGLGNDGAR